MRKNKGQWIWRYLSDFWDEFKSKDVIEAIWDGYIKRAGHKLGLITQVDLSKNLFTVPIVFKNEWVGIKIGVNNRRKVWDETQKVWVDEVGAYPFTETYDIDPSIRYFSSMGLKADDDTGNWIEGEDFVINTPGIVAINQSHKDELPVGDMPDLCFFARTVFTDEEKIYNNFAYPVGLAKEPSSPQSLAKAQGIWAALWNGAGIPNIELGISIYLGAPFGPPGIVNRIDEIRKENITWIGLVFGPSTKVGEDGDAPFVYTYSIPENTPEFTELVKGAINSDVKWKNGVDFIRVAPNLVAVHQSHYSELTDDVTFYFKNITYGEVLAWNVIINDTPIYVPGFLTLSVKKGDVLPFYTKLTEAIKIEDYLSNPALIKWLTQSDVALLHPAEKYHTFVITIESSFIMQQQIQTDLLVNFSDTRMFLEKIRPKYTRYWFNLASKDVETMTINALTEIELLKIASSTVNSNYVNWLTLSRVNTTGGQTAFSEVNNLTMAEYNTYGEEVMEYYNIFKHKEF